MEGTSFAEDRAVLVAAAPVLRRVLGRLHQAGSAELGPLFAELDQLKTLAEAAQVAVLDQGLSRGDVKASDAASPAGWGRPWGKAFRAGGGGGLGGGAAAGAQPDNKRPAEGGAAP